MTEKKFYKLDEFDGQLPNPKIFPTQGSDIVAINGYPNMFTDNFMMDLEVDDDERQRLGKKIQRTVSKTSIDQMIEEVKNFKILLSEPQYIYDGSHLAYVLFTPDGGITGIQVKYYHYFRNRYPDCNFYTKDNQLQVKTVKVGDKLVGLWMPIALPIMEEEDG